MLYTGFRISTPPSSASSDCGDQVFIRAKKNRGDVFAFVPDWLQEAARPRIAVQ